MRHIDDFSDKSTDVAVAVATCSRVSMSLFRAAVKRLGY